MLALRRAVRCDARLSDVIGCVRCHNRGMSSTAAGSSEESSKASSSSSSTPSSSSYSQSTLSSSSSAREEESSVFDELFSQPDAFERHTSTERNLPRRSLAATQGRGRSSQNRKVPRNILGDGGLGGNSSAESELNQEWEDTSSKYYVPSSSLRSSAPQGRNYDRHSLRARDLRKLEGGRMTPEESKTFKNIFANLFDGPSESQRPAPDPERFGSSLTANLSLQQFRERNRGRLGTARSRPKNAYLSTVLSERVTADSITAEEVEGKIDEAREEIVSCQTASDVWQWAATNVWGVDEAEAMELQMHTAASIEESSEEAIAIEDQAEELKAESKASEKEGKMEAAGGTATTSAEVQATSSSESSDLQAKDGEVAVKEERRSKSPRFGKTTPFYAPVLFLLLDTLRESFKSPQSALAVLRVAKNLGPDSFVLGCSPRLYAEALRTRWMILKDLQGARDTLREAKDIGIVGFGLPQRVEDVAPRRLGSENGDAALREVVAKQIKTDVRQHVVDGRQRLADGQSPSFYDYQLRLLIEMDEILGRRPNSQFKHDLLKGRKKDRYEQEYRL